MDRSRRIRIRIIGAVVAVFLSVIVFTQLRDWYHRTLSWPIPEPAYVKVYVPPNADVLPRGQVHPGTFKIEVSVDELAKLSEASSERALIAYGHHKKSDGPIIVEYWLPRGQGIFWHAVDQPDWPADTKYWYDLSPPKYVENGRFKITAVHSAGTFDGLGFFGLLVIWASYIVAWIRTAPEEDDDGCV